LAYAGERGLHGIDQTEQLAVDEAADPRPPLVTVEKHLTLRRARRAHVRAKRHTAGDPAGDEALQPALSREDTVDGHSHVGRDRHA
jgi:hypothetical protein